MPQTVFITGASSGIGRATAKLFHQKGWNVVATMRSPEKDTALKVLPGILLLPLDVTREESIKAAVDAAIAQFGSLDVIVNNAGYGVMGVFEAVSLDSVRRQFDTNVFGLMSVIRQTLPHLRKNRSGTIVNISSVGGRVCIPLFSLYHATKFAVEGFSESLQYELSPLGIRVKCVEPGPVITDFNGRSLDRADVSQWPDYQKFQNSVVERIEKMVSQGGETAERTALDVYRAATSRSKKLRHPSGKMSTILLKTQRFLPEALTRKAMQSQFGAN